MNTSVVVFSGWRSFFKKHWNNKGWEYTESWTNYIFVIKLTYCHIIFRGRAGSVCLPIELLIQLKGFLYWFLLSSHDRNLAWSILDFLFIRCNSCGSLCPRGHRGQGCRCLSTKANVRFERVNGNTEGQLQINCCLCYRD